MSRDVLLSSCPLCSLWFTECEFRSSLPWRKTASSAAAASCPGICRPTCSGSSGSRWATRSSWAGGHGSRSAGRCRGGGRSSSRGNAITASTMLAWRLRPVSTRRLQIAEAAGDDEAFIVGGAELYREALPRADRLYLTRVRPRSRATRISRRSSGDSSSSTHDAERIIDFELYSAESQTLPRHDERQEKRIHACSFVSL